MCVKQDFNLVLSLSHRLEWSPPTLNSFCPAGTKSNSIQIFTKGSCCCDDGRNLPSLSDVCTVNIVSPCDGRPPTLSHPLMHFIIASSLEFLALLLIIIIIFSSLSLSQPFIKFFFSFTFGPTSIIRRV